MTMLLCAEKAEADLRQAHEYPSIENYKCIVPAKIGASRTSILSDSFKSCLEKITEQL